MDIKRLHTILQETTTQFRKGEVVQKGLIENIRGEEIKYTATFTIQLMPHVDQMPYTMQKVDCHFIVIGVDKEKALKHRKELVEILQQYPGHLKYGPSFIEVGGVIGDQGDALRLFALGEVLRLWELITPAYVGVDGKAADQLAGSGFIMISGYNEFTTAQAY